MVRSKIFPNLSKFHISERKIGKSMTLNMATHLDQLMTQYGTLRTHEHHPFLNEATL